MSEFSSNLNVVNENTSSMSASIGGLSGRLSSEASVTNTRISEIIGEINTNSTSAMSSLRSAMTTDVQNIRSLGTEFANFDAYRSAKNVLIGLSHPPATHVR